jgi:hypothetical protein
VRCGLLNAYPNSENPTPLPLFPRRFSHGLLAPGNLIQSVGMYAGLSYRLLHPHKFGSLQKFCYFPLFQRVAQGHYSDTTKTAHNGAKPNQKFLSVRHASKASKPALGPTQPPVQWITGSLTPGIQQVGRDADQSPPSTAKVNN